MCLTPIGPGKKLLSVSLLTMDFENQGQNLKNKTDAFEFMTEVTSKFNLGNTMTYLYTKLMSTVESLTNSSKVVDTILFVKLGGQSFWCFSVIVT